MYEYLNIMWNKNKQILFEKYKLGKFGNLYLDKNDIYLEKLVEQAKKKKI